MSDNEVWKQRIKTSGIYTDQKGQAPFSKWMKSIKDPIIKAHIRARLDRLNFR